jgi:hypothetical protein
MSIHGAQTRLRVIRLHCRPSHRTTLIQFVCMSH